MFNLLSFILKLIFAGALLKDRKDDAKLWCAVCLLCAALFEVSEAIGRAAASSAYVAFARQVLEYVQETGMPYAFLMAGIAYRDWPRIAVRRLVGLLLLLPPAITATTLHDGLLTMDNRFFLVWASAYVFAAALLVLGKNAFPFVSPFAGKEPWRRGKAALLIVMPVVFASLLFHYWSEQLGTWTGTAFVILVLAFLAVLIGISWFGMAGSRVRLERGIASGTLRNLATGMSLTNRFLLDRVAAIELAANRSAERSEEAKSDSQAIRRETEHLHETIERIRFRTDPAQLDEQSYSLNELIRSAIEACARYHEEKKAAIRFRPQLHAVIRCDKEHMMEAFVSLLHNALDALPDRGGAVEIRLERAGRRLKLEFADNGHGIPPEQLPKLREPFFSTRTEPHHIGLGLTYCALVVEKHNGTLELESKPGEGTKAVIRLPMKRVTAIAATS